jgi:riboflavin synthase
MFTGIVEMMGKVLALRQEENNLHIQVASPISSELKVDQSVAHNGVCLTVTQVETDSHWVTAISETIQKTNLADWQLGTEVNLERCLRASDRFDGHIVQGHVDQVGFCTQVVEDSGSWRFYFEYQPDTEFFTVRKGSICVNGVSLTVVDSEEGKFSVAIIPYTYEHTNFKHIKAGDRINLEFDVIGKYVQAWLNRSKTYDLSPYTDKRTK